MPRMTKVSRKKFPEMLALISNARTDNDERLKKAAAEGREDDVKKHLQIELDLEEQHIAVVRLQAKYVASETDRSQAERELKNLVATTRKKVRRVRSLADALNTVAEVAQKITRFAAIL